MLVGGRSVFGQSWAKINFKTFNLILTHEKLENENYISNGIVYILENYINTRCKYILVIFTNYSNEIIVYLSDKK